MEKQRFVKPYWGRYWIYRRFIGGIWRKYQYDLMGMVSGWYWTQDDLDDACGTQLTKVKEVQYG